MSIELSNAEMSMARKVGVEAGRRYRGFVEADDVAQELVLWMLQPAHEDKIRQWREGHGYKALYRSLKHEARRFCEKEKAARVGYGPEDNSGYSNAELRELLPLAIKEDWEIPASPARGSHLPRMTSGGSAESAPPTDVRILDMRRGLQLIDDKQAHVLTAWVDAKREAEYLWGKHDAFVSEYDLLAENYGVTANAVEIRVRRAFGKLREALSGRDPDREYTGRRRVMSRAQAQAIISNQWEGN